MSRRTQRVGNLIRRTLAEVLLSKLSDPRIDPARTSLTRVEIPEDLLTAKVFVSVLGTEGQQTRTIRALQHAAGHLQELLRDRVCLRHTPVLSFELDTQFKKTLQTLDMIERAMEEIRQKELAREAEAQAEPQAQAAPAAGDSPAPDSPARPAGSP